MITAASSSPLWWYAARAGGLVAWGLLAAGVLWGLALSTRAFGPKPRPNWMLDLHRFLGAAAVVFTGIHVVTIILDSYVHFGLAEVLVPFAAHWHPAAVAWGIVSLYALLAVQVTSMLRKRLSKRAWRLTHFLSFPLYVTATIHLLSAGTDGRSAPVLGTVALVTAAIAALTVHRVRSSLGGAPPARSARPALRPAPREVVAPR